MKCGSKWYEESSISYSKVLLVDGLDNCKGKGNKYTKEHIKEIQEVYKQDNFKLKKLITKDKRQIQEEVWLYKLYNVKLIRPKTPEPTFI